MRLTGVSSSSAFAGSFAGSWRFFFYNSLMPKHRSWRRRSESNGINENHYSRTTPRHQRRAASELSNANRIRGFRDAVKHSAKLRKNERTIPKYSSTTRSLALSLALLKSRKCQFASISDIRHWASCATDQASADAVSVVFTPPVPAPLVAPRNIVPAGEDGP